jgi:SNF2 family DNA or RNA helicase
MREHVSETLTASQGLRLMCHQEEGVDFLNGRSHALLADEPGLGKSAQLLLSAVEPVLIVAPAMVLDSGTWDDELAKWSPGMDATQVAYSSLAQKGPRGKIPRDGNGFPVAPPKPEYRRSWGTVIADESHYVKGRKTNWTVALQEVAENAALLRLATGTPIPNWAHEAFTSLQLVWPERAKQGQDFGSYWRWARDWFHVGPTHWTQMAIGDLRTAAHIEHCLTCRGLEPRTWDEFRAENWGDRFLMRLREECVDLPPFTQQQWRVKMTREQRRVYKELEANFVTWLDSGEEVEAWSSAGQLVKLMKCATGLESLTDGRSVSSGKMDALRSLLSDRPFPTLVVAHFRSSVEASAQVAEEVGRTAKVVHGGIPRDDRRTAIRAFQRGDIDVLVASIETVAEGMTLHQGGADMIVRVERSARPSKNDQVNRRLHRMGVEKPVTSVDLVTEDSADERILAILAEKTDQQMLALGIDDLRRLAK